MKTVELTLKERAGRMYRQLLILQRLFQRSREADDVEWIGAADRSKDIALCAAVTEILDELTEHAELLTTIPFPISEWQPGDGPDDERWRALTELERREVASMVSGYEGLITWSEAGARGREATDFLKGERTRLGRFRQEMGFLERRRNSHSAPARLQSIAGGQPEPETEAED
jgi:hypothetical protein